MVGAFLGVTLRSILCDACANCCPGSDLGTCLVFVPFPCGLEHYVLYAIYLHMYVYIYIYI